MRKVEPEERRARLGRRHGLAAPIDTVGGCADAVVALHATDPATVYLSVAARSGNATIGHVDEALFERRSLLRTLAMRRTLFVATTEVLPVIECSTSIDVAAKERKRLEGSLTDSGIDRPERWLARAYEQVLDALDGCGLPARQITARAPLLATRITMGAGTKNMVEAGATSRVLGLMAVERLLARGRPAGGWTGRQYTWHRRDQWIPLTTDPPSVEDAAAELIRRWLARFGPGTMTDLRWWTGWTVAKTKAALSRLDLTEVELDGQPGLLLSGDVAEVTAPDPWAAVLPALDPTPMGWKERDWYLGDHGPELFDRNGNIGPTVWVDGRIVGGWSQRPDGRIAVGLLEKVAATERRAIDAEVRRIEAFTGPTVVKPSFPTPLQRRLAEASRVDPAD